MSDEPRLANKQELDALERRIIAELEDIGAMLGVIAGKLGVDDEEMMQCVEMVRRLKNRPG